MGRHSPNSERRLKDNAVHMKRIPFKILDLIFCCWAGKVRNDPYSQNPFVSLTKRLVGLGCVIRLDLVEVGLDKSACWKLTWELLTKSWIGCCLGGACWETRIWEAPRLVLLGNIELCASWTGTSGATVYCGALLSTIASERSVYCGAQGTSGTGSKLWRFFVCLNCMSNCASGAAASVNLLYWVALQFLTTYWQSHWLLVQLEQQQSQHVYLVWSYWSTTSVASWLPVLLGGSAAQQQYVSAQLLNDRLASNDKPSSCLIIK